MELRFASSREDFRNRHVHKLQTATTRDGRHDWRASAWLLERIFPQDYARRPGRRVDPTSEDHTWLDEAVADDLASDERIFRAQFMSACQQGMKAARTYVSQPAWDDIEPNVLDPLPLTASFDAKHHGPASLPSYATYAEALEQALHFDARQPSIEFPLPTPATSESRAVTAGPPSSSSSSSSSPSGESEAGSKITETPSATSLAPSIPNSESPETLDSGLSQSTVEASGPRKDDTRAAEGRTQASPRPASVTSAALGTEPTNSRPEGTAQESARTPESTSEITETPTHGTIFAALSSIPTAQPPEIPVFPVLAEFPFPALSRPALPNLFLNSRIRTEPALAS
jgi:hypothetical protein